MILIEKKNLKKDYSDRIVKKKTATTGRSRTLIKHKKGTELKKIPENVYGRNGAGTVACHEWEMNRKGVVLQRGRWKDGRRLDNILQVTVRQRCVR